MRIFSVKHLELLVFMALLVVNFWATNVQDTQEISIPFYVKSASGQTILSDFVTASVSDTPEVITQKLQSRVSQRFTAMPEDMRARLGGFKEYGVDPQQWVVYQGKKMFKLFSIEQARIDNYDRLQGRYHNNPLVATYFLARRDVRS